MIFTSNYMKHWLKEEPSADDVQNALKRVEHMAHQVEEMRNLLLDYLYKED